MDEHNALKPSYTAVADSPERYLRISRALAKEHDFKAAIEILEKSIEHYPDSGPLMHELGKRLRGQKSPKSDKKALYWFRKTIEIDPDNLECRLDYGDLLAKRGRVSEAEKILLPLYNIDAPSAYPNDSVLPSLTRAYINSDRFDLAALCCGQCVENYPNNLRMKETMRFLECQGHSYKPEDWQTFLDYRSAAMEKDVMTGLGRTLPAEMKKEP